MIRYFAYTKGNYIIGKNGKYPVPVGNQDFVCVFLEQPSEDEVTKIYTQFKFNKNHFLNYKKAARSMRYSINPLVFVLLDYYMEDNKIKRTHILFLMKKNILVVVIPQKSKYYTELFDHLVAKVREEQKKENQLAYLFYYFLHEDARGNYDVLEEIENKVFSIENHMKKPSVKTSPIDDIVSLKRQCFRMSRHLWASAKLVFTIKRGITPLILGEELMHLMDDIYDTFVHQTDILTTEREILTDLLEIYATNINNRLTVISNELNTVMKKLTALTVILMVPTLITGFYGMNFPMPEFKFLYSHVIVIIAMILLSVILYIFFHKKDWI